MSPTLISTMAMSKLGIERDLNVLQLLDGKLCDFLVLPLL